MWKVMVTTITNDKVVGWGFIVGGLMVIGQLLITIGWGWRLPPEIPLFYSLPVGEQQLGGDSWFLILPISGWLFYITSYLLIGLTGGMVKVLPQTVVWLANVAIFLVTVAMINLLMLVY